MTDPIVFWLTVAALVFGGAGIVVAATVLRAKLIHGLPDDPPEDEDPKEQG